MFIRSLLLISLFLFSASAQAVLHYYASVEQADWSVESSRIRCELNHIIPYYGKGRFIISSGGNMSFMAHTFTPINHDGTVSITSVPPFWKVADSKEMGQSVLSKGDIPFNIFGELATRMLYELDAGMQPTFKYKDMYDDREEVLVSLSVVRFRDKMHAFQHCISQLIPFGFNELKPVTVNFKTNKYRLSESAKRDLEALALFASEDNKIKILVEGYTDSLGTRRYNQSLSSRRARAVVAYFKKIGVDMSQIQSHAYGERHPDATNQKSMGRAFNRRVEVSFSRG